MRGGKRNEVSKKKNKVMFHWGEGNIEYGGVCAWKDDLLERWGRRYQGSVKNYSHPQGLIVTRQTTWIKKIEKEIAETKKKIRGRCW